MKCLVIFILSGLSVQLNAHATGKHESNIEVIHHDRDHQSIGLAQKLGRQSTGTLEKIKRKSRRNSDEDGLSIEDSSREGTAVTVLDFIEKAARMASSVFAEYSQQPYFQWRSVKKANKNSFVFEFNVDNMLRAMENLLKSPTVKFLARNLAHKATVIYRSFQDD